MTPWTLPFLQKSNSDALTFALLLGIGAVFAYCAYRLAAHHHKNSKARKSGVDRRHDGRHGNH